MGSENDLECHDNVVRLRGLPFAAKEEDIKNFLEGCKGAIANVHFTYTYDGRPSGECYVEFNDSDSYETALKYHKQHLGSRYIEVFAAKKAEMEFVLKRMSRDAARTGDAEAGCIRGLPFNATQEDIKSFFEGLRIVDQGVLLPIDRSGRSLGEAFVQFDDRGTAEKALDRHMRSMGHRYVEVFRSSTEEVRRAMYRMNHPAFELNPWAPTASSAGWGRSPYAMPMGYSRFDPFESWGPYYSQSQYAAAPPIYDDYGRGAMYGMSARGFYGNGRFGGKRTRHIVHMRGLPFRATERDIRQFFSPLQVAAVIFGQDDAGRPSGEADVQFFSHLDAVEAMKRDRDTIGHRYVELFLNSTAADRPLGMRDFARDDF